MRQAIINKTLIDGEQLYYTEIPQSYYYCKYFTIREAFCYIEDESIVKEECYEIDEIDTIPDNYYPINSNISFKTINSEKYAILECLDRKYKIPYKFYKNIIEYLYCDIYVYDGLNQEHNGLLIFVADNEIIGWLESCAFKIYSEIDDDYSIEQDCKLIPKEIKENAIFKDVMIFKKGFAKVVFDDFCAKLDSKGNIIQKLKCEDCWFNDEYTDIKIGGKWGVIDSNNNFIIPPKYENIYDIQDDMWKVILNNKIGIIDRNDNVIVDIMYDKISDYKDTSYFIVKKDKFWGIIDKNKNVIIPFEYSKLNYCCRDNDKESCFYAVKNGFTGIINIKKDIIIPFEYKELFYLSKNTIAAKIDNNKFILINKNNKQICSQIFEDIHSNYDDTEIYPAKINGLWGFIDDLGNTKIDFKYTDVTEFSEGYCDVSINETPDFFDDYGLINKNGTLILDYKYSQYCTFIIDKNRFIVEQGGKSFIIDKKGTVIVDKPYKYIIPIASNGFLPIELDNGYKGFIDRNGNPLKINKETLNIPAIKINYDMISQKEKIKLIFGGEEL